MKSEVMTTVFIDEFDNHSCPAGGEHDDKSGVMIYRTRQGERNSSPIESILKKILQGLRRFIVECELLGAP